MKGTGRAPTGPGPRPSATGTRLRAFGAGALVIALGACTPAPAVVPDPPGPAVRVEVSMTEFAFSHTLIDVPAGAVLTIALRNDGKVDHDFVIDQLRVRLLLRARESTVSAPVTVPDGIYEVYCSIPTHKELGMVGLLRAR